MSSELHQVPAWQSGPLHCNCTRVLIFNLCLLTIFQDSGPNAVGDVHDSFRASTTHRLCSRRPSPERETEPLPSPRLWTMPPPPATKTLWDLEILALLSHSSNSSCLRNPRHRFLFVCNQTENKSDISRSRTCPSVMDSDIHGHLPHDTKRANGGGADLMMTSVKGLKRLAGRDEEFLAGMKGWVWRGRGVPVMYGGHPTTITTM